MPSGNAGEVRIKLALDVTDLRSQLTEAEQQLGGGKGIKVPLSFKATAADADTLKNDLATLMGSQSRRIPVKFTIDAGSKSDLIKDFNALALTVKVDAEFKGSAQSITRKLNTTIGNLTPKAVQVPVEFVTGHRTVASRQAVQAVFGTPKRIPTTPRGQEAVQSAAPVEPRARGGPVAPNRPYLVGERGPELFVPTGAGGRIISRPTESRGDRAMRRTNVRYPYSWENPISYDLDLPGPWSEYRRVPPPGKNWHKPYPTRLEGARERMVGPVAGPRPWLPEHWDIADESARKSKRRASGGDVQQAHVRAPRNESGKVVAGQLCGCGYCKARARAAIAGELEEFDARFKEPRGIEQRHPGGFVHPHPHPAGMYSRPKDADKEARIAAEEATRLRVGLSGTEDPIRVQQELARKSWTDYQQARDPRYMPEREWQKLIEQSMPGRPIPGEARRYRIPSRWRSEYGALPIAYERRKRILKRRRDDSFKWQEGVRAHYTTSGLAFPEGKDIAPPEELVGQVNYGLVDENDEYVISPPSTGSVERAAKRQAKQKRITGQAPSITFLSTGYPDVELDEEMDAWMGKTSSATTPGRRPGLVRIPRTPKRPASEQSFRDRQLDLYLKRFWRSKRGRQAKSEMDPEYSGSARFSFVNVGGARSKLDPEIFNAPEGFFSRGAAAPGAEDIARHPWYDRSDPLPDAMRIELDKWTGPKKSVIKGGRFGGSAEVQLERDLGAEDWQLDDEALARRQDRLLWNRAMAAQNIATYTGRQEKLQELRQRVEGQDRARTAFANLYTNIQDWLYNKEVARLNADDYYRRVLGGPELPLRQGVKNPWQYANLVPELRRAQVPQMLKEIMELAELSSMPVDDKTIGRLSDIINAGSTSVSGARLSEGRVIPGFLLGQAIAEEAADAAWKRMSPEERHAEAQKEARRYEALIKGVETQRRIYQRVASVSPVAGGRLAKARQEMAPLDFKVAVNELAEARAPLIAAEKKLRSYGRSRRLGRYAFNDFRKALSYKHALSRQAVDERGEPIFDENDMPVLEELGYLESGAVEVSGAVRAEAKRIYRDVRLEQLETEIEATETEQESERKALGLKRGSAELDEWLRTDDDARSRSRKIATLKDERTLLKSLAQKRADRAMGGAVIPGMFIGGAMAALGVAGKALGQGIKAGAMALMPLTRVAAPMGFSAITERLPDLPLPDVNLGAGLFGYDKTRDWTANTTNYLGAPLAVGGSVDARRRRFPSFNLGSGLFGYDDRYDWSAKSYGVRGGLQHKQRGSGGPIAARQLAPHYASGRLPELASAPGAYLVGERGPEEFITSGASGTTVGRFGPEVILPSEPGVITANHWDGDPDQVPGPAAKGFLRRNLPWMAATATMGLIPGRHTGGDINVGGRMVTPPGGGHGPHAHGDYNRLYGYVDNGRWTWVDLSGMGPSGPLDAEQLRQIAFSTTPRGSHRSAFTGGVEGGRLPRRIQGQPPLSAGPIVAGPGSGGGAGAPPPYAQTPYFRRVIGSAPLRPTVATRGAPSVAQPVQQESYLRAQEEMTDLQQRIERVRIQASDALQLTPVRALSVSLGQQFQERFGGRQQIRQRESMARQRANDAGRVANRLATQVAKAEERKQQVEELRLRNQMILSRGGQLTQEQRDEMRLAQLQRLEARRAADVLRPEAERLAIRAEISERGEKRVIQEARARAVTEPTFARVFMGNDRQVDRATGRVVDVPQYMPREALIRREAAEMRRAEGGGGLNSTGGVLQRGNVMRAQGMGLVGIVGGTMLFTRAVQASAMAFEQLGRALDPLLDAWTGFTATTEKVSKELSAAVISSGGRGGVATLLGQQGIAVETPALERRAALLAGSQNLARFQEVMRAEQGAQAKDARNMGITQGFRNGIFTGIPLVEDFLGWVGQDQSLAERFIGGIGPLQGAIKPRAFIPGYTSGGFDANTLGVAEQIAGPGTWINDIIQKDIGGALYDAVSDFWFPNRSDEDQAKGKAEFIETRGPFFEAERADYTTEEMRKQQELAAKYFEQANDALDRVNPNLGDFVVGLEETDEQVEKTAKAVEALGGDQAAEFAKYIRNFGVAFVDETGKVPDLILDAFGNAVDSDVWTALEGVMEGFGKKSFDQLFRGMQSSLRANIRAMERQAEYTRDVTIPSQFYRQTLQQPIMPAGYGVVPTFGTTTFGGPLSGGSITGPRVAQAAEMLPQLESARDRGRQAQYELLMRARGYQGPPPAPERGLGGWIEYIGQMKEYLATSIEVRSSMAEIESLTKKIQALDISDTNASLALQQEQYNRQLFLSKRSAGDLLGQAGLLEGTYKRIIDYTDEGVAIYEQQTVEATRLGQLQRAQIMDQRQLSNIQLARSQRELNMSLALARLRSPGETAAERAVRRREAEAEAREAQQMLNINRRSTRRGFVIQDIQISRSARDALKDLGLTEAARSLQLKIQGSDAIRQNLRSAKDMLTTVQDTWTALGEGWDKLSLETQAQLEADSKDFRKTFTEETKAIFNIILSENKKSYGNYLKWLNQQSGESGGGSGGGSTYDPNTAIGGGTGGGVPGSGGSGGGHVGSGLTADQVADWISSYLAQGYSKTDTMTLMEMHQYVNPERTKRVGAKRGLWEKAGYATGGIFGASVPTNFIAGEAGPETVLVIRNPKLGMASGGSDRRGGGATVNININASVRDDRDVDSLVRKVVREIHKQSELIV